MLLLVGTLPLFSPPLSPSLQPSYPLFGRPLRWSPPLLAPPGFLPSRPPPWLTPLFLLRSHSFVLQPGLNARTSLAHDRLSAQAARAVQAAGPSLPHLELPQPSLPHRPSRSILATTALAQPTTGPPSLALSSVTGDWRHNSLPSSCPGKPE